MNGTSVFEVCDVCFSQSFFIILVLHIYLHIRSPKPRSINLSLDALSMFEPPGSFLICQLQVKSSQDSTSSLHIVSQAHIASTNQPPSLSLLTPVNTDFLIWTSSLNTGDPLIAFPPTHPPSWLVDDAFVSRLETLPQVQYILQEVCSSQARYSSIHIQYSVQAISRDHIYIYIDKTSHRYRQKEEEEEECWG